MSSLLSSHFLLHFVFVCLFGSLVGWLTFLTAKIVWISSYWRIICLSWLRKHIIQYTIIWYWSFISIWRISLIIIGQLFSQMGLTLWSTVLGNHCDEGLFPSCIPLPLSFFSPVAPTQLHATAIPIALFPPSTPSSAPPLYLSHSPSNNPSWLLGSQSWTFVKSLTFVSY